MYVSRQCLLLPAVSEAHLTCMAEAVLLTKKEFKTCEESEEETETA